jgi:hypothetical protein
VVADLAGFAVLFVVIPTLRLPPLAEAVTISNPHGWHSDVLAISCDAKGIVMRPEAPSKEPHPNHYGNERQQRPAWTPGTS